MNNYQNKWAVLALNSPECISIADDVKKIVSEARADAKQSSINQIASFIKQLSEDSFRVAIVGEFSRGKSSICNNLIDRNALPIGDLPTTARITKVTYFEQDGISYVGGNGQTVKTELSENFWDMIPSELSHDTTISVCVNSSWLKSQNLTLIDTPGINDVERDALPVIFSEIQQSDAVIVAISALMAMSQTEKTFIEEHILTSRNPKVAIVITRLDDVKPPERQRVIEHVRRELASIDEGVPIFCFRGYDNSLENIQSFEKLKELISDWASTDIRNDIRLRSWGEFLKAHLATTLSVVLQQENILNERDGEKRKKLSVETLNVDKKSMMWEEAKIMVQAMSEKSNKELDRILESTLGEMSDTLAIQLRNAPQPKNWYEEVFPLLARREFIRVGKNMETVALKKICLDYDTIRRQFAPHIPVSLICPPGCETEASLGKNEAPVLPVFELKDVTKKMMYLRAIFGIATAGSYFLFGPLGTLISVGGGIANELMHMGSVKQQKQWLETQLRIKIIPDLLEERKQAVSQLIDKLYSQILDAIDKQRSQWQEQQEEALQKIREPGDEDKYLLERCQDIKQRCNVITRNIDQLIKESK